MKGLTIPAIAATLAIACGSQNNSKPVAQTEPAPILNTHSQAHQPTEQPNNLEEKSLDEVVRMTGKDRKNLNVKFSTYGTETNPLDWGYRGGTYLTVKDAKDGDLFLFSQRGEYLGVASPLHKQMETRWGKGNAWKSVQAGSDSKRVFVWYSHSTETVYTDTPTEGGKTKREFSSSLPVYKVVNSHLVKDKPYKGIFGGDSQHYIDDRGNGLFFVVTEETIDSHGKTLSEAGQFFNVVPGNHYEDFALVQRKAGSNVLEPSCVNCELGGDNIRIYQTIVPRQMQSTSYQSNPVKNKAHQKRRH